MEKVWLKSYPPGVPAEIDPSRYQSLVQMLEESFANYSTRRAFVGVGTPISYAQLDKMSKQVGAWLQSLGLQRGARVALMMPNVLQYPICVAAVLRAGYTVVNVNPLYTPRELEHQLKDSGAEVIVILENFASVLQQVVGRTPVKHVVVAAMGDLLGFAKGALINFLIRNVKKMVPAWELPNCIRFNDMLKRASSMTFRAVEAKPDDIAFLQYTGGTTGVAKGAVLTHGNIVANVLQTEAWMEPALTEEDRLNGRTNVVALPLYHIYSLTVCCMMALRMGATGLLIANPRDVGMFIRILRSEKFHTLPLINTLYAAMMNHPDFAKIDFSSLRMANSGGMATQKAVADQWKTRTGVPILEGYGLSETSPVATANLATETEFTGTIGLPVPNTDIAIRDDDGNDVPLGQPGEICIRGPQVMAGYWNRPDETAKVMTADGFFKSGDVGVMDERGFVRIVDRKKDMILVSGFNVYPNELEDVVAAHPGVLEVAALGVPDDHSGEVPKLFIVKRDPNLSEADIRTFCQERLTGYKRPKYIEFRDDLPKTPVGKILRRELRDQKK